MSAGVALLVFILAFVIFSMVLKVPVSFGLAIASLFVYLGTNMNPITVAQYSFASLDSFALLAIPFYIFAGCCFANKLRKIFIQSAKKKRRLKGF